MTARMVAIWTCERCTAETHTDSLEDFPDGWTLVTVNPLSPNESKRREEEVCQTCTLVIERCIDSHVIVELDKREAQG